MKLFGYEIAKSAAGTARQYSGEKLTHELRQIIKDYNWARSTLTGIHRCAEPETDPFKLATLLDSNGYHSNAVYLKQVATIGQGWTGSDALKSAIEDANEDESFQDLLEKTSLDLEIYGNMYVEPFVDASGAVYFYHSPALLTRVVAPKDDAADECESFLQFAYKKGYGLQTQPYQKFKRGMRTGIRQLKLASPKGDPWYGRPEYFSIVELLMLNFSIVSLAKKWFENSMVLDKLFVLEGGKLDPASEAAISTFMRRTLKGLDNAAKSLLLTVNRGAKLTVQDMNNSAKENPFGELRKENRDEIASGHRVPPRLLSIMSAGQFGSTGEAESQMKIFKTLFADARQRKVERFWQRLFGDCGLPDAASFKLKGMDITAGETDAQTLSLLTGNQPIITPQEAHEEWMTEKGRFTAKGAANFMQFLNAIEAMRDKL